MSPTISDPTNLYTEDPKYPLLSITFNQWLLELSNGTESELQRINSDPAILKYWRAAYLEARRKKGQLSHSPRWKAKAAANGGDWYYLACSQSYQGP